MAVFRKILVANRGEIALRILRTCRAMGRSSVAVYSDTDANSPHVALADEAAHVESYLNAEAILEASRKTGCNAIHPGYGFLSENAEFAEACAKQKITFIGPSPETIALMGDKIAAKKAMTKSDIPIVAGYSGTKQDMATLTEQATEIGFPLLIKASAGGGGRGMRLVHDKKNLKNALEGARREAERAFGNGALLLEKYIEESRHIEVQILGDMHGHLIHLFERECSLQRRYQKILEETPAPSLDEVLRNRILDAAVRAGRAADYYGAGTVEFLVSPQGKFYFLEMNTRLQVEHPVTEMITGIDLVKLQIEIAEGKPLALKQNAIIREGHAIEVRLCAEDPANDFLPCSGKILEWKMPAMEGIRVDSGVTAGSEVQIQYDSLLAKVIAHGSHREEAISKLRLALQHLCALGVPTNSRLLSALLDHPKFLKGTISTQFIESHLKELLSTKPGDKAAVIITALYAQLLDHSKKKILPSIPPCFRNNPYRCPSISLESEGQTLEIAYDASQTPLYQFFSGSQRWTVKLQHWEAGLIRAEVDGIQRTYQLAQEGNTFYIHSIQGTSIIRKVPLFAPREITAEKGSLLAPMTGKIMRVMAKEGQQVSHGDPLVVLEAMKMEHTLHARENGVIKEVHVREGDTVQAGIALVEIAE